MEVETEKIFLIETLNLKVTLIGFRFARPYPKQTRVLKNTVLARNREPRL